MNMVHRKCNTWWGRKCAEVPLWPRLFAICSLVFGCCLLSSCWAVAAAAEYGIARVATPVLNTEAFSAVFGGDSGRTLKVDSCGQVRELEFVALPGTLFTIHGKQRIGARLIYRVTTEEYPTPARGGLYVDAQFLSERQEGVTQRKPQLPPVAEVIAAIKSMVGASYVWGSNVPQGVPELAEWYYVGGRGSDQSDRLLAGIDCSGLLYFATNGWTPRNTSQLVSYGQGVAIAGKQRDAIAAMLQPLDLIVWNGHVIIVLDQDTVIESRLSCGAVGNGGVVITSLRARLAEVLRNRKPVDNWPTGKSDKHAFVVRRWYGR